MRRSFGHGVARLLRSTRLLGVADSALFLRSVLRERKSNRAFRASHPDFPVPPAHLAFDAYGNTNHAAYVESGTIDARMIAELVNQHLAGDEARICEWGCGPGRVIRHLRPLLRHSRVTLYGTDYNEETVAWCRDRLEGISFEPNGLAPPLPFADGSLDCVYAISVLTHLSEEMHFEWVRELARVVRPGGVVVLTTHSNASADRLLEPEERRYAAGELVVRGQVREGKKWYLAYQPEAFMRDRLLKDWTIESHTPFSTTQDAWVARR